MDSSTATTDGAKAMAVGRSFGANEPILAPVTASITVTWAGKPESTSLQSRTLSATTIATELPDAASMAGGGAPGTATSLVPTTRNTPPPEITHVSSSRQLGDPPTVVTP